MFTRTSIVGFLFGFSLAASFAAYNLLDEYKAASAALQASVQELQQSTEKVCCSINFYSTQSLKRPPCVDFCTRPEDRAGGERYEGVGRLFGRKGGLVESPCRDEEDVRRTTCW
jgi:hypothetical protein